VAALKGVLLTVRFRLEVVALLALAYLGVHYGRMFLVRLI
jgi:hypothetical protein